MANPVDDTPRLAVIIPLDDARGNALEHLSSWTSRQTYPRERFQIVLGTDGSWPAMESRFSQLLMPHDRVVRCARGSHERTLCDAAARAASAEILLFTELHCIASPSCVLRRSTSWLGELIPRLLPALLGSRTRLYAAWAATRWNEVATQWLSWNQSIRWRRYQQSAACMIRLTRLSWALAPTGPPDVVAPTPPRWPVDTIPVAQRVGFHGLERYAGGTFRWSEPVALLRMALPPGRLRLTIETRGLRGTACEYLRGLFWDGRLELAAQTPDLPAFPVARGDSESLADGSSRALDAPPLPSRPSGHPEWGGSVRVQAR